MCLLFCGIFVSPVATLLWFTPPTCTNALYHCRCPAAVSPTVGGDVYPPTFFTDFLGPLKTCFWSCFAMHFSTCSFFSSLSLPRVRTRSWLQRTCRPVSRLHRIQLFIYILVRNIVVPEAFHGSSVATSVFTADTHATCSIVRHNAHELRSVFLICSFGCNRTSPYTVTPFHFSPTRAPALDESPDTDTSVSCFLGT